MNRNAYFAINRDVKTRARETNLADIQPLPGELVCQPSLDQRLILDPLRPQLEIGTVFLHDISNNRSAIPDGKVVSAAIDQRGDTAVGIDGFVGECRYPVLSAAELDKDSAVVEPELTEDCATLGVKGELRVRGGPCGVWPGRR